VVIVSDARGARAGWIGTKGPRDPKAVLTCFHGPLTAVPSIVPQVSAMMQLT